MASDGEAVVDDPLKDVREMYGACYQRDAAEERRLKIWRGFAEIFKDVFRPTTFVDVGCGAGGLVVAMQNLGVDSFGIEGSTEALTLIPDIRIGIADLRRPVEIEPRDLVACFDVAEHIGAAETLCDTLSRATKEWLLFGAAAPGQGGLGHIDLRPHEEWDAMLAARGLVYDPDLTRMVDERLERVTDQSYLWWIRRNFHVYKKVSE